MPAAPCGTPEGRRGCGRHSQGAASLEYLDISLVALALLSISVFALTGLRGHAERAAGDFSFRASAVSLANAISEVCALGSGRSVVLDAPVSVEYADSVVRIGGGSAPLPRPARCGVGRRSRAAGPCLR